MTQNFGPEAARRGVQRAVGRLRFAGSDPYVTEPDVMVICRRRLTTVSRTDARRHLYLGRGSGTGLQPESRPEGLCHPRHTLAGQLGKRMVVNSVMVGFVSSVTKLLSADAVRQAVADSVPLKLPGTESAGVRKKIRIRPECQGWRASGVRGSAVRTGIDPARPSNATHHPTKCTAMSRWYLSHRNLPLADKNVNVCSSFSTLVVLLRLETSTGLRVSWGPAFGGSQDLLRLLRNRKLIPKKEHSWNRHNHRSIKPFLFHNRLSVA